VSIAPEKGGDWLRMQCLPTARGLPFKQDAVFGMSARCSNLGKNTPLRVVKEGQRDRRPTGFPNRQLRDSWAAGSGRPAMLTKMTDADWIKVLRVFEIVRSRRGDKGRDDRKFLSALHYFSVHNITWRALPAEFGIGPDIDPRAALGDKGYDSKSNRNAARQRGICPVIPYRSNVKDKSAFFPKVLYKGRARIEQTVGKLKRFKRIALRCEKTAQNYGSFVALACAFILIKSVHTA
jgi:transposase